MLNFKCPQCQSPITVRNTEGLEQVKIICPNCQREIVVKITKKPLTIEAPRQKPATQPSQVSRKVVDIPKDDNETVFGVATADVGVPVLILNGLRFPLMPGHNVVGRQSDQSTATLQLPVDDRYMSRSNAFIDVTKTDMGAWQVVVSSSNSRNLAKINNHPIDMGNRIILQDGNRVGLGHTELLFTFEKQ